jgi:hypothetical protein
MAVRLFIFCRGGFLNNIGTALFLVLVALGSFPNFALTQARTPTPTVSLPDPGPIIPPTTDLFPTSAECYNALPNVNRNNTSTVINDRPNYETISEGERRGCDISSCPIGNSGATAPGYLFVPALETTRRYECKFDAKRNKWARIVVSYERLSKKAQNFYSLYNNQNAPFCHNYFYISSSNSVTYGWCEAQGFRVVLATYTFTGGGVKVTRNPPASSGEVFYSSTAEPTKGKRTVCIRTIADPCITTGASFNCSEYADTPVQVEFPGCRKS